ncbi:hypothetical protein F511_02800 [Dorcoceras hygrometricum]|uniref:Uncharacterized protein n=1 Tax=Dorcoceras hygrometricum TaxID=472368 RepID=A0A2Z7BIY7_9LAMI|nr:hypothetical protein F511_02800 [Dorcoceras hygrometricum]
MAAAAVASSFSTSVQSLKCLGLKTWPNDHHQLKISCTRILRSASVSCFLGNESNQPVNKWRIPRLAAAVAQEEAALAAPVEELAEDEVSRDSGDVNTKLLHRELAL